MGTHNRNENLQDRIAGREVTRSSGSGGDGEKENRKEKAVDRRNAVSEKESEEEKGRENQHELY